MQTTCKGQTTWLALIVCALLITGCPPTTGPTTPPPIQVANSINTLAQSLNAATSGLIAARDAGELSQADLTAAFNVITPIANAGKLINNELRSSDTWEIQKVKILGIVTGSGAAEAARHLPPNARAIMVAAITLFNSISTAVGGPSI